MYIKKYWGNFIGGSDDSLNLVVFLEDLKKEEIPLSEIFVKIGLDKQNWDFRQTVEYLEFTHSDGVEMDFHFAIDVVTDLAAILLECSVSGSVNPVSYTHLMWGISPSTWSVRVVSIHQARPSSSRSIGSSFSQ